MKYRQLSAEGDYSFGNGRAEFYVDSPAAVAQAVKTRLGLAQGEWFLDLTEGTPYSTQILGTGTMTLYDQAIQERILGTPGVSRINEYASVLNRNTRQLTVTARITTIYGETPITSIFGI